MNTRVMFQLLRSAILTSLLLGATASAQTVPAVQTAPLAKKILTVAVLLPEENSPFMPASQILLKGIEATNATSSDAANLVLLPRKSNQSIFSQLQDAALAGADVAIGPLAKDSVTEISQEAFLPVPIVALNLTAPGTLMPEMMMTYSMSLDLEAQQIVNIAIGALPESTSRGSAPKVMIFDVDSALEKRIGDAYAKALEAANVQYERVTLTPEMLAHQRKLYEDLPLTEEEQPPKLEKLPDANSNPYEYRKIRLKNKRLMAEYRARLAFREPPFFAAFLAMDARTAALVRPRMPRMTRVWATSLVHPGDLNLSPNISLTYDLQQVGMVDAPLCLLKNADDFVSRFEVKMPSNMVDRRLFAFGSDAYTLAKQWAHLQPKISFDGTTGHLEFDYAVSSEVKREGQPMVILSNRIQPRSIEQLQEPLVRPELPNSKQTAAPVTMAAEIQSENAQQLESNSGKDTGTETPVSKTAEPALKP